MISLTDINLSFGEHRLIETGKLNIPYSQVTLLQGESGCGKTTLLMGIALLHSQMSMNYNFDELNDLKTDKKEQCLIRQNDISIIFQENYLFEHLTLIENIQFHADLAGNKISEAEIRKYLDFVRLDLDFHTNIKSMSGGEKQRLAVVCGIVKNAKLFIFDEPTAYLDEENKKIILSIIQQLAYNFGKMVLVASHDDDFLNIADQVYKIIDLKVIPLKETQYQMTNLEFKRKALDKKVLRKYVYKKNKISSLIMGFFMGVLLAGFTISLIYGHFYQKEDELALLSNIHYQGQILRKDNQYINVTEQTRIKQQFNSYQIYPYTTIQCHMLIDNIDLNNVEIKAYYPQSIQESDILVKNNHMINNSIYVSYEIYHYYKERIFKTFNIEDFEKVEVKGVLKPNYDQEKSIYVPYNMLKDKLANKSVELGNVPVIKMIVELNSLDDYHDISKNLSDYYIFTTSLDISSQSQFIQVFGSIYLVFIWIFMIIILSIYKIYRVIGDKRNIALLQTLGVNHSQLVNMKIFEESISLLTMSLIAFSLSTVLTLLFASQLLEMLPIFILVILINAAILLIINLIIYILFLKRYTPEFLLK